MAKRKHAKSESGKPLYHLRKGSQKGKNPFVKTMEYTKTHTSAKAASEHAKKIRARGGHVATKKEGSKHILTYHF